MSNDNQEFPVVELKDSAIPGIATRYQQLQDQGLSEEEIFHLLSKEKTSTKPVVKMRGPIGDWLKSSLATLKGRTLVKDLGNFTVPVTWLVFDIPHKSRASLEWKIGAEGGADFSLQILGTGFGAGRSVSWSVTQAIEERETPVVFIRDIIANVKLYETPSLIGKATLEAETSIVSRGPARLISEKHSKAKLASEIDTSRYAMDYEKAVDLLKYDVALNEMHTYSIDKEMNISVGLEGLNLPLGISTGISAKLTSQCSCVVSMALAPGFVHQPYWDKQSRGLLPFWSIRK